MTTAGFVLAGGRSLRMGRDKALLPWHSGVLVQDVAVKLAAVAGRVAIVGNPDRYSGLGFDCLPDLRPGFGPLSGIETALHSRGAEYNLLLACDMPDVSADHLKQLLHTAQHTDARCVVTCDETGQMHPLCAVYRSGGLATVTCALDEGRLKLLDLVDELGAIAVRATSPVRNINTPEDWQALHADHGF
ncbi:MAG: molybdenum cofactor guanylyltransferase [Acidobacteriota bacterium]|nr:molybdenum cofactor guanylyltransferase [Acidobacteriota bacterium]